jgi:hypothetical protein
MPMHWLLAWVSVWIIGISFVASYHQGNLPGVFAIPLDYGDVVFALTTPLVAYWYAKKKSRYIGVAAIWSKRLDKVNFIFHTKVREDRFDQMRKTQVSRKG